MFLGASICRWTKPKSGWRDGGVQPKGNHAANPQVLQRSLHSRGVLSRMAVGLKLQGGKPYPCGLCKSPAKNRLRSPDAKSATHRDRAMYSIHSQHPFTVSKMMGSWAVASPSGTRWMQPWGSPRGPQHQSRDSLRLHMFILVVIRGLVGRLPLALLSCSKLS